MHWLKPFVHWGFLIVQLVTALLALRCFSRSNSMIWKIFTGIWLITFLVESTGKMMGALAVHNFWLYNLFDVIFYPAIISIYVLVYRGYKIRLLPIGVAIGLTIWSVLYLLRNGLSAYNTYYAAIAGSCILVFGIGYLVLLFLDKEASTPLRQDYYYWFSVGFIIYFSFNTVMLGMYNSLVQSKVPWLPDFIFYANHFITLVLHVFLWIGFTAYYRWTK